MSWIAAGIGSAALTYQIYSSETQKSDAKKGLAELNKTPFPTIGVSPELQGAYGRAQGESKYGFSPEQTAEFNQSLARSQNTQNRAALDTGGGQIAGTLNRMNNVNNINALNTFASKGAGLKLEKEQYADSLAGQIQGVKSANDQAKIQQRIRLEQAYGGALRQGQENENQAIGSAAQLGAQTATSYNTQQAGRTASTTTTQSPSVAPDMWSQSNTMSAPNAGYNPYNVPVSRDQAQYDSLVTPSIY